MLSLISLLLFMLYGHVTNFKWTYKTTFIKYVFVKEILCIWIFYFVDRVRNIGHFVSSLFLGFNICHRTENKHELFGCKDTSVWFMFVFFLFCYISCTKHQCYFVCLFEAFRIKTFVMFEIKQSIMVYIIIYFFCNNCCLCSIWAVVEALLVKAFALQAEGRLFESYPRQT